jgi:hypothetical protein
MFLKYKLKSKNPKYRSLTVNYIGSYKDRLVYVTAEFRALKLYGNRLIRLSNDYLGTNFDLIPIIFALPKSDIEQFYDVELLNYK